MARRCFLKCVQNSHPPIPLVHEVELVIGRSKLTQIKDPSCSRQQLSLKANCEDCTVEIKQIGVNTSGFDGFAMNKDAVYKIGHLTKLEILLNNHFHTIEFDPASEIHSKKRKLEGELTESRKKSLKLDSSKVDFEEAPEDMWDDIDNGALLVFTAKGVKSSEKIAAFDMDGTLIKTKTGKVHPVDTKDWQIAFPPVAKKLKEQLEQGFKIVIMSNQAAVGTGRVNIDHFKKKIQAIVDKLQVPIQAFIATGRGYYRKPAIGMWEVLTTQKNDGIKVDMDTSFYCGDAAGRPVNWAPGKKKDHSMADNLMAENLGLKFYTPEQYFFGHSGANVPVNKPDFNPRDLKMEPFNENLISKEKEVLVLVGFPGSGKSFLAKEIAKRSNHKYAIVCRDEMGSWQKCASEAKKLLQQGKSVIVDSTNPDVESRARWSGLARESQVPCRCAKMAASLAHARHNNKYREIMKMKHVPVTDIVFHSYKNKFVEPKTSEGFKEVITVKFSPWFDDTKAEKVYRMHLLEK